MRKKRLNIFFLLIVFFSLQNYGMAEKNFMWKVESDNSTVYLLGSIHVAKASLYPLSETIEKAFSSSDYLVVEVNEENVNPLKMLQMASYTDSNTLEKNISKGAYDKLVSYFEKHNFPKEKYNKFKPWFALMTILGLELITNGYDPEMGIDSHFMNEAKEADKPVLELESFDAQMEMLEKGVTKFSEAFISLSLGDYEKTAEEVDKMFDLWKKGDAVEMEKSFNADTVAGHSEAMKFLLDERNYKMADKVREYLKSGKTHFVVVGSAHLVGSVGLVNLLNEDKKYKIKQM